MAAFALHECGGDPGYLIGGLPLDLPASYALGSGSRFVVDTHLDGDRARVVTFAGGAVAREVLVGVDDDARRLSYSVVEGPLGASHHNASAQAFAGPDGDQLRELLGGPIDDVARVKAIELVRAGSGVGEATEVARDYVGRAVGALEDVPPGPAAAALAAAAGHLVLGLDRG